MNIVALLLCSALSVDPDAKDFVGPPAPATTSVQADDPQTIRMRIDHNMRATEEQLRQKKVGEDAKRLQEEVLRDIDQLIALLKRQPPQGEQQPNDSSSKSDSQSNDQSTSNDQQGGNGQQIGGGGQRTRSNRNDQSSAGGGSASQPGQGQSASGASANGEGRRGRRNRNDRASNSPVPAGDPSEHRSSQASAGRPGDKPGEAKGEPGRNPDATSGATMDPSNSKAPDRLGDVSQDVWGHLPETLRQEANQFYRQRFMPRYREQLQQYYNRLAETERRDRK